MDSITEQLSQLQELTDEQLSELENSVLGEFDNTESQDLTPQTVDKLEQLAGAVEAVRNEKSRRVAAMEALNAKAAEATARVRGSEANEEGATEEAAVTPEDDEELPQDAVPPADEVPAPVDAPPADEGPPGETEEERRRRMEGYSADTKATETKAPDLAAAAAQPVETPTPAPAAAELSTTEPAPDPAPAPEPEPAPEPTPTPEPEPAPVEAPAESTEPAAASEASATEQTTDVQAPEGAEATSESESTTAEAPAEAENNNNNPEVPVTAAAQGAGDSLPIEPPADRRPQPKPTATLTITAGADIPGISAGTKFDNMAGVAEAFTRRLHTLRNVHGGDGEQHIVASLQQEFPDDRKLNPNDASENTDKIHGVTAPEAITAAAGICLPLETRYELGCDVGVTDRPIRDALARFGADRGGIRYFSAPVLADEAAATGFWRGDANGQNWHTYGPDRTTATTPADQKPCLEIQCTTELTAYIEAITLCLTFNNLTTRAFPELVKRHNELALVAHARVAENSLLARLEAGSTAISVPTQIVGATREMLNVLGAAIASYRHKNRMNSVSPLRMVAPMWMMEFMRADIALQMPGDGLNDVLGLAEAQINTWFRARNVNITWHLDGVGPAVGDLDDGGGGTAVGFEWPTQIEFGLWAEGTWLYLDGGTLDLGVIRDSSLVATNQYKQFVETFEGLANVGCDSYWVTAPYKPTGQAASLVDTLP